MHLHSVRRRSKPANVSTTDDLDYGYQLTEVHGQHHTLGLFTKDSGGMGDFAVGCGDGSAGTNQRAHGFVETFPGGERLTGVRCQHEVLTEGREKSHKLCVSDGRLLRFLVIGGERVSSTARSCWL